VGGYLTDCKNKIKKIRNFKHLIEKLRRSPKAFYEGTVKRKFFAKTKRIFIFSGFLAE